MRDYHRSRKKSTCAEASPGAKEKGGPFPTVWVGTAEDRFSSYGIIGIGKTDIYRHLAGVAGRRYRLDAVWLVSP